MHVPLIKQQSSHNTVMVWDVLPAHTVPTSLFNRMITELKELRQTQKQHQMYFSLSVSVMGGWSCFTWFTVENQSVSSTMCMWIHSLSAPLSPNIIRQTEEESEAGIPACIFLAFDRHSYLKLLTTSNSQRQTDRLPDWRAWAPVRENYHRKTMCSLLLFLIFTVAGDDISWTVVKCCLIVAEKRREKKVFNINSLPSDQNKSLLP